MSHLNPQNPSSNYITKAGGDQSAAEVAHITQQNANIGEDILAQRATAPSGHSQYAGIVGNIKDSRHN